MRLGPLLPAALLLLALACTPEPQHAPQVAAAPPALAATPAVPLDVDTAFGEGPFLESCTRSRGYERGQCDCALRTIGQRFEGTDQAIALLYLQLTMLAERDLEAMTELLDPRGEGVCRPRARSQPAIDIVRRHKAPVYLHRVLARLELTLADFKLWDRRAEILAVRRACLPPPAALTRQAQRIENCLEESLGIGHCSRCHDSQGVEVFD